MDINKMNSMLDKAIKKAHKPMWRKNLETIIYILIFFVGTPLLTIYLYNNENYIWGTLLLIIFGVSIMLGFWGQKITNYIMTKYILR